MPLPTITRGIGFRDDYLNVTGWTADSGVTATSDGDILSLSGTTASNGFSRNILSLSLFTAIYPKILVRTTGSQIDLRLSGSGSETQTVTIPTTSGYATTLITPNIADLSYSSIKWLNQPVSGRTSIDFILFFKELLTLPTAIRPLQEQDVSIMPVIPIVGRQGGVVQYLGSMSPRYIIAGGLVNTTSGQSGWTNTYTADQWWQLLKGVWIEQNTVQADGNPTWQWFSSDNINAKVLLNYAPQQVPGRLAYHDYALSLTEFNILGLSTADLPGISY